MEKVTIKEAQKIIENFVKERKWETSESDIVLHLIEELGEIARNVLKNKNYGGQHIAKSEINMDEELGDLLYLILKLSNQTNINLEEAFLRKLEKIRSKYPIK